MGGAKNDAQGSALGEGLAGWGCHLLIVESGGGGWTERGTWQFQDACELATRMSKAEGSRKESWDHGKYSHAKVVGTNQISQGQREKGDKK